VGVVLGLVFADVAYACVCLEATVAERLEQADAAVVGRAVEFRGAAGPAESDPTRIMTFDVEQRVKGDVEAQVEGFDTTRILVRVPRGTDCDVTIATGKTTGLLLTRQRGETWFASACSIVEPGALVAAGGEPRGGVIKVVIGVFILAIVLSWALRRKARGARPSLPGAP
jgi:hypothetical protein